VKISYHQDLYISFKF